MVLSNNMESTKRMRAQNPKIRPLTEADADAYHALRLRALREHPTAFAQPYESHEATPISDVSQRLQETSQSPSDFILGMFYGDELIGMVGFRRESRERVRHKGSIWGMYIASEAQGQGLGRALMREAIAIASTMPGLEQINLGVISGNESARSLYMSLGFESYGLERRAIAINGEYHDDEFMQLVLDTGGRESQV